VARKPKSSTSTTPLPPDLKRRIEKNLREGRAQQALELAKELCRQHPGLASESLLRRVYLEWVRELRTQGRPREARALLDHLLTLPLEDPCQLEAVAVELVHAGDVDRARELARRAGNSLVEAQVLGVAADVAVQQREGGRALLPDELRPAFDLILQAFAQLEAGGDDVLKETLRSIGLQSPFLEWKVLIRGLQAYYAGDDARAVENWSRLRSDRLPARLAAPFRFAVDPVFRTAQPPETQAALQRQADRLHEGTLVAALRSVQAALSAENLPQALRLVEGIVPRLRQQAPPLAARLARVFQGALIHGGDRPDLQRYRRIFGAPADDPELHRLEAIALERCHDCEGAHKLWQKYEHSIAVHPTAWPNGQADKVRALIWAHLGENADRARDVDAIEEMPAFFRAQGSPLRPLRPTAEECFDRSLQLDPDQLSTYMDLVQFYLHEKKPDQAAAAARRLLARFPDHVPTLEVLADLLGARNQYAEALPLLQRARQANPLEPRLGLKLGFAQRGLARVHAEAGHYDEARAGCQAALALLVQERARLLCQWAACEYKAGETARADELVQQALAAAGHRLPVAFATLVELIRIKAKLALKKRFEVEFAAALEEPAVPGAVIPCLHFAASLRRACVKYAAQKGHEKLLTDYLGQIPPTEFTEDDLLGACAALEAIADMKQVRHYALLGRKRFKATPHFLLFEADTYLRPRVKRRDVFKVQQLLHKAGQLAAKLPPEQCEAVQAEIRRREEEAGLTNWHMGGPLGALAEMFERMSDGDDDLDDDDDWR
jgi:tetratricopeptide (TPR) repeat protein